jgi:rod shape-determining protein MreC
LNRSIANRRIIIIVALAAGITLFGALGALGPLRWIYDGTIIPISRSLSAAGSSTSEAFSNIGNVHNLSRDLAASEQENAELKQRLAADAETRRDNEILRGQLGLNVAGAPAQIGAEVVAFQPDSYRQFVMINKGSRDGIKKGQGVMSEGALIGVISDTQTSTAMVALVTDPEFRLTAKDQDGNATGVVSGQLGSGLIMEKIGQTDIIKPGDTITSAGFGGDVPAGLLIGQVQSVNTSDNAIFQSARLVTPLKINRLRFVFVVKGS